MVKTFALLSLIFISAYSNAENIREKWSSKTDGSKFIDVRGTNVHYRDFGSGNPIVLLHGICDSLHTWRKWKDTIVESGYRYIAIDIPGFGLTNGKEIPYNSKGYSEFLHHLFKKLDIKRPIVIGNSLGGYIAWNYALDYPKDIEKLVLLSPAGYPLSPPFIVKTSNNKFLKWIAKNFTTRMTSDIIARGVFFNRNKMEEQDLERFYDLFKLEGNFDRYMKVFEEIMKLKDHTPNLSELKTPTLLIWGKEDSWIPFDQSKFWQRDVKNLTFFKLEDIGHTPQLETPMKSVKIVLDYLKSN